MEGESSKDGLTRPDYDNSLNHARFMYIATTPIRACAHWTGLAFRMFPNVHLHKTVPAVSQTQSCVCIIYYIPIYMPNVLNPNSIVVAAFQGHRGTTNRAFLRGTGIAKKSFSQSLFCSVCSRSSLLNCCIIALIIKLISSHFSLVSSIFCTILTHDIGGPIMPSNACLALVNRTHDLNTWSTFSISLLQNKQKASSECLYLNRYSLKHPWPVRNCVR